jgi:1,4-alpha-glucan branching enzyme
VRLSLAIEARNSVEVMGDFSDWQPVVLERASGGVWTVDLSMSTGLHHINVRIDGGPWQIPSGLPTSADEFGSDVGVFFVP